MVEKTSEPRIKKSEDYTTMLDNLKKSGIFEKHTNTLIFAACLGFKRNDPKPVSNPGEPVRLGLFDDDYDEAVINAIAILEKNGDAMMLAKSKEQERIEIFERYAHGGLAILEREIFKSGQSWEDALISLILKEFEEGDELTDLTTEISELSKL